MDLVDEHDAARGEVIMRLALRAHLQRDRFQGVMVTYFVPDQDPLHAVEDILGVLERPRVQVDEREPDEPGEQSRQAGLAGPRRSEERGGHVAREVIGTPDRLVGESAELRVRCLLPDDVVEGFSGFAGSTIRCLSSSVRDPASWKWIDCCWRKVSIMGGSGIELGTMVRVATLLVAGSQLR